RLRTELAGSLAQRMLAPLSVELGMLYSAPEVRDALARLRDSGAQRILVLPLFPQYCGATTAAVYDQVSAELRRWRALPELRFIADYHEHPGYIEALRASVTEHWLSHARPRRARGDPGVSGFCRGLPGDARGDRYRESPRLHARRWPALPVRAGAQRPRQPRALPRGPDRAALPGLDARRAWAPSQRRA